MAEKTKIAETIFNLKNIAFKSRPEGSVIFENEEVEIENQTSSIATKNSSKSKFLLLFMNVLLILMTFGSIIAIVCVYRVSRENYESHNIKFSEIEKLLHQDYPSQSTSASNNISNKDLLDLKRELS